MTITQADIRRQAARLLDAAGFTAEPVSLRDVVSALNLEVLRRHHEPFACEAALEQCGDGHAIVLNGNSGEHRRRFTIAHEIGHFVLHPQRVSPQRGGAVTQAGRSIEREADQFAAELLMPEDRVKDAVRELGPDIVRLCDRFDVSRSAMRTRLRRLGLMESDNRQSARGARRD